MNADRFTVSISEALRQFLDDERRERGLESVDDCVEMLLREAMARRPGRMIVRVKLTEDQGEVNRDDEGGVKCTLTRLRDDEFREHSRTCIAINDLLDITRAQIRGKGPLLAQTYAVCKSWFGERGRLFDDWKGGFSFPLELSIEGHDRKPAYLMNIFNFRSGVNFQILQCVDQDDPRLKMQSAFDYNDPQFSPKQLSFLIFYLIGFIEGYSEHCGWNSPFLLQVQSNLILYGYSPSDGFFNREFEDNQEYESLLKTLTKSLPAPNYFSSI